MWYALLIPVLCSIICYKYWPHKITIGELFIPIGVSLLCIVISYYSIKEITMRDIEYNGELVVEARYYEPYDTWVTRTCYYSCGTSKHPRTCYRDCSYCDHTSARYEVVLRDGSTVSIGEAKYLELVRKWNQTPEFVELNRNINYRFSCGKDGDMYRVKWDGKIKTSESHVREVSFSNPVKISHSAFKFPDMTTQEADSIGLYHYPLLFSEYRQTALLAPIIYDDSVHVKFEFINGLLGSKYKVKVFTLLFINKPIDIAFKQEQYFEGGNQNELVVCIGIDSLQTIQWVKPFSWCDNKRICIDTREDIAELHKFNPDSVISIYYKNIPKYFHYKSFADFNYLVFEPTKGQLIFVYTMTLLISIGCCIFIVKNQIEP